MKLNSIELGQGQAFVIIHGLFGYSDNWISHAKKLSEYFKVILLDMRNHGHSAWSNEFSYSLMAEDLKEFFIENNLNNVILLGHSMGGKVAMEFCTKNEKLIEKLIIVDITFKEYPMHHQQILAGLHSIKLTPQLTRKEAENQISKYIDSDGVKQFLLKNLYWNSDKKLTWRMNIDSIEKNMQNILNEVEIIYPIIIPALFIRGIDSNYILEDDIPLIEEKFIDVKITDIDKAGHWVHAEKPVEFLNAVLDFCLR